MHSVFGYEFSILSSPSAIGVMWFIRDLMVAMVLSPIVWWIVRRMRMWSLVVFFLPYILYIGVPVQGFGLAALCFFPAGATFSICGKDVVQSLTRWGGGNFSYFFDSSRMQVYIGHQFNTLP